MSLKKKLILLTLSLILFSVAGVCVYGIQIYSDATNTVEDVYQSVAHNTTRREQVVNIDAQEPFSVLLMGIDTGDLGRVEQGRADTTMVVTINPQENKSTMISLERDILTELVGNDTTDKLNHAYAYGGAKMAIDTVENLLDIPIDSYVSINMKGLKDLIDAVGGIQVNNTLGEFTLDGIVVPAGEITLDGTTGLAYARMRKEDPEGDIGRQRRQREVVEKIVNKIISLDGISKYRAILDAVKDNVKTDLTWDDMMDIQKKYLSAFKNINPLQLAGKDTIIDGVYYQLLDSEELYKVQTQLRNQLGLAENTSMLQEIKDNYDIQQYNQSDTYATTGYVEEDVNVYSQDAYEENYWYEENDMAENGYYDSNQYTEPVENY